MKDIVIRIDTDKEFDNRIKFNISQVVSARTVPCKRNSIQAFITIQIFGKYNMDNTIEIPVSADVYNYIVKNA
ncbi:MAG: hypothetical protein M0R03_08815 [Novosphingobium sp.]|nr:hypothetical protein [Novosphingobium sp.]